jgi:hypothetical protein
MYGPTATTLVKSTLDGKAGLPVPSPAYPKVPYVMFTEGIARGSVEKIQITESGSGANTYNITASDITCSTQTASGIRLGCAVIDTSRSNTKVWLYPRGKTATAHQAYEWSTAGRTYTVNLPVGSFSDSITTGVNKNDIDSFSYTFAVLSDVAGPTLSSVELQAPKVTGATLALAGGVMGTPHSAMYLTFNENVALGENTMAIKKFDYSAMAPVFSPSGATINDKTATVVLSFDQKVQTGTGTVALYNVNGNAVVGTAVTIGFNSGS